MNKIEPRTLKGFRDFLPAEARKRQYVANALKKVFESFGFEPLETPVLEYEEILSGKYGEEGDKLMYRFEDNGKRRVALRYDQTVPLARVAAQYKNDLPLPFKRYQISNVFRGENTQAGRFREFTQCDIDTIGSSSLLSDAQTIACVIAGLEELGFEKFKVIINDRNVFSDLVKKELFSADQLPAVVRSIDKLKKIGNDGVIDELGKHGLDKNTRERILRELEELLPSEKFMKLFEYLKELGIDETKYEFDATLARGLDYYTGTIFEVEVEGYDVGSVAGGGRFDELVGMFSNQSIPAVGAAFGFDRIIEAMVALNLFPDLTKVPNVRILVTVFSEELLPKSMKLTNYIRESGLNAELYDDPTVKLEKQIKYADRKGIMYAAILGPEEIKENKVTIKNLRIPDQQTIAMEDLLKVI
ncbi:MAG TPA: histidine--tRNA ligase [Patescibacteria group bacterium]|nr:histidine--tRNA ligase [Patescibacteria group bacterium]